MGKSQEDSEALAQGRGPFPEGLRAQRETFPYAGSKETLLKEVFPPTAWFREEPEAVSFSQLLQGQQQEPPPAIVRGMTRHECGTITYLGGLWVPPSLRAGLLDTLHLSAHSWHPGTRKMAALCKGRFQWDGLRKSIVDYVRGCVICQRARPPLKGGF